MSNSTNEKNSRHYPQSGLDKLARIARQARGDMSYRKFEVITGLCHAVQRRIECREVFIPEVSTLKRLAPYTPYTFQELIAICMDRPEVGLIREYRTAEDVLPIVKGLPRPEIYLLARHLIDLLAEIPTSADLDRDASR